MTIVLTLDQPTDELTLHAVGLTLTRASCRSGGGKALSPKKIDAVEVSQTVLLRFGKALAAGESTLEVDWEGKFSQDLRGLYLAKGIAATQFEAADARRVFPCFDEPAFKATWALTLDVPRGLTALANGRVSSQRQRGDRVEVSFEETERISSYLVAFVVGALASTPEERAAGVPVRTWAAASKGHLVRFGQDVALAVLPRLQDYFGLPYAFGKLDQVGIPDFEAGAMENAGLITYREVTLLLDPASAPLSVRKRIAEVVTHELAHQWFGNWVTMVWWDDLWLNEAFATWMAYKIVDRWQPQWRLWHDFEAGKAKALQLDALLSTHPIRPVVKNAAEAGESFDAITYEKGGAVLRMIEGFLGEEAFREGIRRYMKKHARSNAVALDLWRSLEEASSQPIVQIADAWIGQPGFPLLSIQIEAGQLAVSQRRFYSDPSSAPAQADPVKWPVPIVVRFGDEKGVHERRILLRDTEGSFPLQASGEVRWLIGNAGNVGVYRVEYSPEALCRLAGSLNELTPLERIGLLGDGWALVRAGRRTADGYLSLLESFRAEEDEAVLAELVGRLSFIESRLIDEPGLAGFRRFVEQLLGEGFRKMGWDPKPGESDSSKLRRAELIRGMGWVARGGEVIAEANERVGRILSGDKAALDSNLLDVAVAIAARSGGPSLFERLLSQLPKEADPATQRRYLSALACFEDPALVDRTSGLLLTDVVPMQDVATFAEGLLANHRAAGRAWKTMRERWEAVIAKAGGPFLVRRVVKALGLVNRRDHLDEVKDFLVTHPPAGAQQAVAQMLEQLSQDVALRERTRPELISWLGRKQLS